MEKFKKVLFYSHFVALVLAGVLLLINKENMIGAFFATQAAYLLYRLSEK